MEAIREMQAASSSLRAEGKNDEAEILDREVTLLARRTTPAEPPPAQKPVWSQMIDAVTPTPPKPQGFNDDGGNRFMKRQKKEKIIT